VATATRSGPTLDPDDETRIRLVETVPPTEMAEAVVATVSGPARPVTSTSFPTAR
jgi:hypothetical protein